MGRHRGPAWHRYRFSAARLGPLDAAQHIDTLDRTARLAIGSILLGIVVLGLKLLAWRLTGSVALYSDALESVVNVITAAAAFAAVRWSAHPPDPGHPFGHAKAEYLSAVLEGVLIVLAALSILREAWQGLQAPHVLTFAPAGLLVNAAASALNAAWAVVLLRHGRRWRSLALVADARHLLSDVVTSVGVLAGVALATVTGWAPLDPLVAMAVALHILWIGWRLLREAVGGLMDEAPPPEVVEQIHRVIGEHQGESIGYHDLRARHAGHTTFIQFSLVVPGVMTVARSHALCDRIEEALRRAVAGSVVTIHVEPEQVPTTRPAGAPDSPATDRPR